MSQPQPSNFINILIAEDNDISREMMVQILRTQGYNIFTATDGDAAIEIAKDNEIDVALVDINMAPTGGFEYVRYLLTAGIKTPVVIITGDDSSDILIEATSLSVAKVLHKPVTPDRLISTVHRILKRRGYNPQPMGLDVRDARHSPQELMEKAIALANENAINRRGGPFGAVVADSDGKVLGRGVNGITSRADPTAHAEVMAIRQAAEKLSRTDLSDCTLYCSSEPTMIGRALIVSVGIKTVYYGLSHDEIRTIRAGEDTIREELANHTPTQTEFVQMGHDEALAMFRDWNALSGDKPVD